MARFLVIAASSGIGNATVNLLKEAGHSVFTDATEPFILLFSSIALAYTNFYIVS